MLSFTTFMLAVIGVATSLFGAILFSIRTSQIMREIKPKTAIILPVIIIIIGIMIMIISIFSCFWTLS